jgi:uncharacterized membrane protein YqaE (UPF0057 family)
MRLLFIQLFSCFVLFSNTASSAVVIVPNNQTTPAESAVGVSKKEKKAQLKEFKKNLKSLSKSKRADDRTLLLAILAIILPPLAVYIHQQDLTSKFWISLILTLCFWIPGVIYSLLVVLDVI